MIIRYPTGVVIGTNNEVQKANVGDGFVQGADLTGKWRMDPEWSLFGGFSILYGETTTYPTAAKVEEVEPISKMMPPTGLLGIGWRQPSGRYAVEASVEMADHQHWLNSLDQADTQRIPPDGTPGYAVVNVRGELRPRENLSVGLAVRNIGNVDYRIHGSGSNEPGTNFVISADWKF